MQCVYVYDVVCSAEKVKWRTFHSDTNDQSVKMHFASCRTENGFMHEIRMDRNANVYILYIHALRTFQKDDNNSNEDELAIRFCRRGINEFSRSFEAELAS